MLIGYNYRSIKEIDKQTLDYLRFVVPDRLEDMKIEEINDFLTNLEKSFIELDGSTDFEYE